MVCGEPAGSGAALYCGACGAPMVLGADLTSGARTPPRISRVDPPARPTIPRLSVLDASGEVTRQIPLEREITTIGRSVGDLRLDDDLLDPEHAVLTRGPDRIVVRTVGSSLGNWLFVSGEHRIEDGDLLLLGSQVIRFVKLNPRLTADRGTSVRQVGSRVPENDVGVLEQLLHDGTVRDSHHVADGELVRIGRTDGDWIFPYDATMSARHAEIRNVSATEHMMVRDLGSRNGVGIAIRGEQVVRAGERLLLGRHMLRVELV
jgi:pSer/pThr/pTyr-binding forkhead associated (FHA) protein